jgi:hypothetical protein
MVAAVEHGDARKFIFGSSGDTIWCPQNSKNSKNSARFLRESYFNVSPFA